MAVRANCRGVAGRAVRSLALSAVLLPLLCAPTAEAESRETRIVRAPYEYANTWTWRTCLTAASEGGQCVFTGESSAGTDGHLYARPELTAGREKLSCHVPAPSGCLLYASPSNRRSDESIVSMISGDLPVPGNAGKVQVDVTVHVTEIDVWVRNDENPSGEVNGTAQAELGFDVSGAEIEHPQGHEPRITSPGTYTLTYILHPPPGEALRDMRFGLSAETAARAGVNSDNEPTTAGAVVRASLQRIRVTQLTSAS